MQWNGWIYFGGTVALFIAFVMAIIYYFNPKRKSKVEEAKYRMLEDDDEVPAAKDAKKEQGSKKL